MSEVTRILERVHHGDPKASEELLPLVYQELRRLAASKMAQQPPGQTLQATALVHEAWLRLTGNSPSSWRDRQHFFRAAAEAMRQILVDRARRRLRLRHGQNAERVDLNEIEIAAPAKEEILLRLNDALVELQAASPERAEVVKLRFFVGLSEPESAEILRISERSDSTSPEKRTGHGVSTQRRLPLPEVGSSEQTGSCGGRLCGRGAHAWPL